MPKQDVERKSDAEQRREADKAAAEQRETWDAYNEDRAKRLKQRGRHNTADATDASLGWTVQAGAGFDEGQNEVRGPQVYIPEQLPDPTIAQAAGQTPQAIPPTLIISDDEDAYSHPRGPEPGEMERAKKRAAVLERVVENGDMPITLDTAAVSDEATSILGRALAARADKLQGGETKALRKSNDDDSEETSGDAYTDMSKDELEAEVARRGIDATGTKAELSDALRADDESK